MGGQRLEIEPLFPPTDLVSAFAKANRRIYMTGTLSDDSVLVTHFGADAQELKKALVPASSQSMGERMVLLPQDINPDIELDEVRQMLKNMSAEYNVVIIVPSDRAALSWGGLADQILGAADIVEGVEKLRSGHVGLTVLVNRYDGIDLPGDACRVLAIFDLPEVNSFREATDQVVLSDTNITLRRQIYRVEQGMGRGVRSNDDYCVVLLCGSKLTQRIRSQEGKNMLTPATRAQMELSARLTNRLLGASVDEMRSVAEQCLNRDNDWVKVSRQVILRVEADDGLWLDPATVVLRQASDLARKDDPVAAEKVLIEVINELEDDDLRAWLRVRLAEIRNPVDPAEAQKILAHAYRLNPSITRPLRGVTYQKLNPVSKNQAARVQEIHRSRFVDAAARVLEAKSICDDLKFDPDGTNAFESALQAFGAFIGLNVQRPERDLGEGPDNLWAFGGPHYFVIECKSGATSMQGVSKSDLGQLEQAVSWFDGRYSDIVQRTAIIVHPLTKVGPGATVVEGMRVIDKIKLSMLKKAFTDFCVALGDENIIADVKRIDSLIKTHKFTPTAFIETYSTGAKS